MGAFILFTLERCGIFNPRLWGSKEHRAAGWKREGDKIVAAIEAWREQHHELPATLKLLNLNQPGLEYWGYARSKSGSGYYLSHSVPGWDEWKSPVLSYESDGSLWRNGWTLTDDFGETTRL